MEAKLPLSASALDLSRLDLPPALQARVKDEVDSILRQHRSDARWEHLLAHGTRAEIIAAGIENSGTQMVVLLGDYGSVRAPTISAMPRWHYENPRAPVVMRGSKEGMREIYGPSWRLAYAVFMRFVRVKKITAFTADEFENLTREVRLRLYRDYCASYHFGKAIEEPHRDGDYWFVYLNGRGRWYTEHQARYIQRLRKILEQNDRLEERLERARLASSH